MPPHSIVGSSLFHCTLVHCLQNTSDDNVQCTGSDPVNDGPTRVYHGLVLSETWYLHPNIPLVGREFNVKPPDLLDDPVIPVLLLSPCSLLLRWRSKNGKPAAFTQVSSIFSISSPYLIRKLVQREWSADSSALHPGSPNMARITFSRLRSEALLLV